MDQFSRAAKFYQVVSKHPLDSPLLEGRTISLHDCAGGGRALCLATRLALTDLFQAFGRPDVSAITAGGELVLGVFSKHDQPAVKRWAEENGVPVSG